MHAVGDAFRGHGEPVFRRQHGVPRRSQRRGRARRQRDGALFRQVAEIAFGNRRRDADFHADDFGESAGDERAFRKRRERLRHVGVRKQVVVGFRREHHDERVHVQLHGGGLSARRRDVRERERVLARAGQRRVVRRGEREGGKLRVDFAVNGFRAFDEDLRLRRVGEVFHVVEIQRVGGVDERAHLHRDRADVAVGFFGVVDARAFAGLLDGAGRPENGNVDGLSQRRELRPVVRREKTDDRELFREGCDRFLGEDRARRDVVGHSCLLMKKLKCPRSSAKNSAMKKKLFSCLFFVALCSFALAAATDSERKFNARRVYGKIRVVNGSADFKVRVAGNFLREDLRVRIVGSGKTLDVGRWRIVSAYNTADYTVRFVNSDEDLRVRFVDSGEGPAD